MRDAKEMGELLLLVAGAILGLIVVLHFIGTSQTKVFMPLVMGMVAFFVGGVFMSFRTR
jgi:predicted membrane channel-forming protein YqfA (hemolysin III family)